MKLHETKLELDLEESYQSILKHRQDQHDIYGVVNRIAQVEKKDLGITEWNELGLEQWEDMLGKADEWVAQDLKRWA